MSRIKVICSFCNYLNVINDLGESKYINCKKCGDFITELQINENKLEDYSQLSMEEKIDIILDKLQIMERKIDEEIYSIRQIDSSVSRL